MTSATPRAATDPATPALWWWMLALSLGAAVSLGITRFAYGLLLPPMRQDLDWSYTLAGAMNTANAVGYLLGAFAAPWLLRRMAPTRLLWVSACLATVCMAMGGVLLQAHALLAQRLVAGVISAALFVAGGLLATRVAALAPRRGGLMLGIYYGGTGWGIAASALVVPVVLDAAAVPHVWQWAWWAMALVCALMLWPLCAAVRALGRTLPAPAVGGAGVASLSAVPWRSLAPALVGYALFGLGYIGYMTFVVALLREQGMGTGAVTLFYALLGMAVVASPAIWASFMDRCRGGQALALFNALLGLATLLPALTQAWPVVLASGLLFGLVFQSLVASTTVLVRHNLPQALWAGGISLFTIMFAVGQIFGPTLVGSIADAAGSLRWGLVFSACTLWLGAAVAWRQRAFSS